MAQHWRETRATEDMLSENTPPTRIERRNKRKLREHLEATAIMAGLEERIAKAKRRDESRCRVMRLDPQTVEHGRKLPETRGVARLVKNHCLARGLQVEQERDGLFVSWPHRGRERHEPPEWIRVYPVPGTEKLPVTIPHY